MTAGIGGSTKKFAFGVSYQLGYAVGNIIGPQTFRGSDAPNYYVSSSSSKWYLVELINRTDREIHHVGIPCLLRRPPGCNRRHARFLE